jgi:hypothetical protein
MTKEDQETEEIVLPVLSTNWAATLAAVRARGQRCDICGHWTFRLGYFGQPKTVPRLCPDCLPAAAYRLITGAV